ncbi:hypothetical protein [Listeria swaminathanii]|uniref:DUF4352 domain-containing protein n=1 Tax=Listeria swaminathanii TaxID=2713501 RepID=A0A7X1DPB0_9LIST|nr:hypothetical protein [Listeria swaminathanii]MBC2330745.1 hypothetical protein [Listeria swaminathanii]
MKKGILLITGFMLAFNILLVGCGNNKNDIQVTDTNDKSNFDEKEEAQMKLTETEITPNDKGNYSIIGIVDKDASVYIDSEEMEVSSTGMFATASNYTGSEEIQYTVTAKEPGKVDNIQIVTILPPILKDYSVGDSQELGGVKVTLINVEKTSDRNQFDDTNPKNVVKISYKVENNSGSEYFVTSDIDVYDANSTLGTRYPLENTTGKIPNGKNMNAEFNAGVNESGNIEIVFNLFSDASLTFHAKI